MPVIERSVTLPAAPDSPPAARRLLREVLRACGRPGWVDAAELALAEIATNVVLHAHCPMTIRIACSDDHVRVEVEDFNVLVPQQRDYAPTASTGRGLALVAALTREHGVTRTAGGKVVWFTVGDAPAGPAAEEDLDALLDAWADEQMGAPQGEDLDGQTVTLLGFPPTLWLAVLEMHDALLRELALYRAGLGLPTDDLAAADRARFTLHGALDRALADGSSAAGAARLPAGHPSPMTGVLPVLDLRLTAGPGAAGDFATLQDVLDDANTLAAGGLLLTPPSLPEVVAVRDWAAEQIISSLAGAATIAWPGADAPHFADWRDETPRAAGFDVTAAVGGPRAAVVVDAGNRLLGMSPALADVLGWDVDLLVGRRVVALIPARFREAHVAGLTRHLSTGQGRALRVPLQLPVLRADGTEVLCDFFIEDRRTTSGRSVYVAYIWPAQDPA